VIAVDKGLEWVSRLGLHPHILIGDMDSLDASLISEYQSIPRIVHQEEKNETDTELAVRWCIDQNRYKELVICNDLEGRIDHALAIIQNLRLAYMHGLKCRIETMFQTFILITGDAVIRGHIGDLLSLIPLDAEAVFKESSGLKYSLENLCIKAQQSRGISNEFIAEEAKVSIAKDLFLPYRPFSD
jgi:thiamine pyrophosphokinase